MKQLGLLLSLSLLVLTSCHKERSNSGTGFLYINVGVEKTAVAQQTDLQSRAGITDAGLFTVAILKNNQVVQKFAPIGSDSKQIALNVGLYNVTAYSEEFSVPAFEKPVYGASAPAQIVANQNTPVVLNCAQTNAGVKIIYSDVFKSQHSSYQTVVSQTQGSLTFSQTEARLGYFLPGAVDLTITADGTEYKQSLTLEPRKVYEVTVQEDPQTPSGNLQLTIHVSTDVVTEDVVINFPPTVLEVPADGVYYYENVGKDLVSGVIMAQLFKKWLNPKVSYTTDEKTQVTNIASAIGNSYPGCSCGNYIEFTGIDSFFLISGIKTSHAPTGTQLVFSFGACATKNFDPNDILISYSTDGITYDPMTYDCISNRSWQLIECFEELPITNNLCIKIVTKSRYYMLDDFKVSAL